jgi:phage-related protein (TIGR01555 family)
MSNWFSDVSRGLVNAMSNLGSEKDKGAQGNWYFTPLDQQQAENAYRSNWMSRKAIDIPALDMMREGWAWQCSKEEIALIKAEEKRLQVYSRVFKAIKQARLLGGAGIIISDGKDNNDQPLVLSSIKKGGVQFIRVMDRYQLSSGLLDFDPMSPTYMEPIYYDLIGAAGGTIRIHPSRVVRFLGNELPVDSQILYDRWADSILDSIEIAIRDATAGQQGIAALVQEAKVDVYQIDGFMEGMKSEVYKRAVVERFSLVQSMKSTVNALVLDKNDTYQQKSVNFAQLPEVQRLQLQIVSGAADIPATRFLGQSPEGMNSTGDGDLRNYYDRISAEQELHLREPLEKLMDAVVRSALGDRTSDCQFRFRPLYQMSEKDKADIFKTKADAARVLAGGGDDLPLVPVEALSDSLINSFIEAGDLPGLEAAMQELEGGEDE